MYVLTTVFFKWYICLQPLTHVRLYPCPLSILPINNMLSIIIPTSHLDHLIVCTQHKVAADVCLQGSFNQSAHQCRLIRLLVCLGCAGLSEFSNTICSRCRKSAKYETCATNYVIRESRPQFENWTMARVYVRSLTCSTMYQKAPFG